MPAQALRGLLHQQHFLARVAMTCEVARRIRAEAVAIRAMAAALRGEAALRRQKAQDSATANRLEADLLAVGVRGIPDGAGVLRSSATLPHRALVEAQLRFDNLQELAARQIAELTECECLGDAAGVTEARHMLARLMSKLGLARERLNCQRRVYRLQCQQLRGR